MSTIRTTLLSGAAAVTMAISASPALALFGPVCIPTLPNCGCTYIVPCPVADATTQARALLESTELKNILTATQSLKDPQAALLKAARGEFGFGIPGLNSIGIDINGLMSGDLSSLGLPAGLDALASDLSAIGIDGDMIAAMANGELTPSHFLQVAQGAGVDFSMLEQAGLSMGTIEALASGQMDASQMLSIAQNLGLQGNVLTNLGISERLIQDVAAGIADPQQILNIAQNAGLDMAALGNVGLDAQTITALANGAGPEAVMSILQKAGFDSSAISGLGLDAGMLGQIASGQLPASAINNLVAGTGIDPSSLVIPGAAGPISIPGERPRNPQSMVSIPISEIPGLENVLARARGEETPGASTMNAASNQAMCASDMTLISTSAAPNGFGADLANIDMAISGANLEAFPENVSAAEDAAAMTFAFGIARASTAQPLIVAALSAVDSFEDMMGQTKTAQDDVVVNDTIQAQLMTARAETASMMTALVSVKAAARINKSFLSPVPLFPQDSRFAELVEENVTEPARERTQQANQLNQVARDHSQFIRQSRNAILHHNLMQDALIVQASIPEMERTIDTHEDLKGAMMDLETVIKSRLQELYGAAGTDQAWDILRAQLYAARGSYVDTDRYEEGFSVSAELSQAVTAEQDVTAYGRRLWELDVIAERGSPEKTYTQATETPYAYAALDERGRGIFREEYRVIPATRLMGGSELDEGATIPRGFELVGVFQNYLELLRREAYAANLRRGDANVSMTGNFWTEMVTNAPQCLSGPLPLNNDTLARRPELFDLSKDCAHFVWSFGDPGDYIDSSQLGGADAALWLSKITLDRVLTRTGGPAGITATLQSSLDMASDTNLASRLRDLGHNGSADHVGSVIGLLQQALGDTTYSTQFAFPSES